MKLIDVSLLANTNKRLAKRQRVAPTILAKDTTPYVEFLAELPSGDLLVVESPNPIKENGRVLRRRAPDFTVDKKLKDVRGPAALSPSGKLLLVTGPIFHGRDASCLLVDVEAWKVLQRLPLVAPFVWIDDSHFAAQTPGWEGDQRTARRVDPKIARGAEHWMTDAHGMALVDLERGTSTLLLESEDGSWECAAVLSPDLSILYSANRYSRVSATRLANGKLLWQKPANRLIQEGSVNAMAFDRLHDQVVTAGGGKVDFVALDAKTGAIHTQEANLDRLELAGLPKANRFECITTRTDGALVLATEKGTVVEVPPSGPWEAFQVAGRAIQAMTFVRDGSELVVGGAEKNLRQVGYEQGQKPARASKQARVADSSAKIEKTAPLDDGLAEEWVRVTRERNVQGASAAKVRESSDWPWQVSVSAMELVREKPLESALRRQVATALRLVPRVKQVREEDRGVWSVAGKPSGEDLVSAVSAVIDALSDQIRRHIKSLKRTKA